MSNSTVTSTSQSSSAQVSSSISSVQASISSSIASSISSAVLSTSNADSTTTVPASSTNVVTSVVSASSVAPTTQLITSVVTESATSGDHSSGTITVVVTSESHPTSAAATSTSSTTSSSASSTSSSAASLQNSNNSSSNSGGLSAGGKTAVAVVVPVVVVALLVLAGIFFWRRRKQKKVAEEARRLEVEEYGFNPNNDPTLPAIAADGNSEMTEDRSGGYRGWGSTNMSNRKASTTISGGHTQGQLSDSGSNPGYSNSPQGGAGGSDGHSGDPLVNSRDTMNSDDLGALGAAPVAGANRQDMRRGPSNASSSYSMGNRSDHSDPPMPAPIGQAYSGDTAYNPASNYSGFSAHGPYGDGSYGGGGEAPVVRDVNAQRNARIEQARGYQQGNSGIAQNF